MRESKLVSHTSPVDGEITLKYGISYKNVLCIECKDYYIIRNLYILNMSVKLHCTNGRKCIIRLTLIGLSCSRFRIG